jgi:hypothetical protein
MITTVSKALELNNLNKLDSRISGNGNLYDELRAFLLQLCIYESPI